MSRTVNAQLLEKNSFIKPYSLRQKTYVQGNIDKSIIGQLPQSMDLGQRLRQKDMQIQRLTHALQFYRNGQKSTQKSINPFDFYLNSDNKKQTPVNNMNHNNSKLEEYLFGTHINQLIENASRAQSYKIENDELKEEIKDLREEIIELQEVRKSGSGSQKQINRRMKGSQVEVNRLRSEIWSLQAEIGKLNYENTELKKALNSITKIKLGQESQSMLKVIQQSSDVNKGDSISSNIQTKLLSELKHHLQTKSHQCQLLKQKYTQLQTQLYKLNQQQHSSTIKQNTYNHNLSPNKRRSPSYSMSSQKKALINSISQFQMIDVERYQLKIAQKNKDYQQLYSKYQKVQSQKIALEDLNDQLQRQRKFLADRLGEIEILQQGDQVVGQMENKLVLMSTQLMRLGNLNRNKLKQTQQLNLKLKQTIHKLQLLTKDNIEKDKIILNYKQQLTMIQHKIHQKNLLDDYDQQTLQEYKQQLLEKDKELTRLRYLNKQLQEDIKTYELKIKVFQDKISRLQHDNRDLQKQIKDMEKNLLAQSSVKHFNLQLQLQRYKTQCDTLSQQIKSLQLKLSTQRNLFNQSQTEKTLLITQKQSCEDKLNQVQSKMKKYEFRIEEKQQELRDLRHSYEDKMISKNDEIRKITEKITLMQRNAQSLMKSHKNIGVDQSVLENMHKIEEENMVLKIQLSKYEQRVAKMTQQVQRLNLSLQRVSMQNQSLNQVTNTYKDKQKQHRQSKRQVQALTNKIKRLQEEKSFIQSRSQQTIRQLKQLQPIEGQYRRLKNQYQTTVHQLQIKQQQVNSLTKRLQGSGSILSPRSFNNDQTQRQISVYEKKLSTLNTEYSTQVNRYTTEISGLRKQLQSCKLKLVSFEHIQSEDNLHEQLSQQIIRLNNVLGQRIAQIVALQKQLQLSNHKVTKCQQLLSNQRNSKLKEVNSFISQNSILQNQQQTSQLKSQQKQILLLTQRLKTTKQSNRSLQQRLDLLMSEKIRVEHRVSQLQYMKGQRSMVYHQNQTHLTNLISEIRISNQRLQQSIKQIQHHYIEKLQEKQLQLKRLDQHYRDEKSSMERQVYELQSDYRRLQAECREKESLLMQNQQSSIMQQSQHQNIVRIKEEYQVKLVLLSQQVERCKMVKDQKVEELQRLKGRLQLIEEDKKQLIIENQSNKNTVQILSGQIQRLSVVLTHNIDEIRLSDKQIHKLHTQIEQLQKQTKTLKQTNSRQPLSPRRQPSVPQHEYESLNQIYVTTKNNLLSSQQQLLHLQQQLNQHQHKIQTHKNQNLQLQQQYHRLGREKRLLTEEKDQLEAKLREVKRNQQHLRELLNDELRKKEKTQLQLFEKNTQIDHYKSRQKQQNPLNILKDQIQVLKQSNNSLQAKFELILTQNQKLVYQVQNFKRSKSNSISSNKNEQTKPQQQQLNLLKSQNHLLRKQIHQLQQRILQNNKFRGQVQSYQQQVHQYQLKVKRVSSQKGQLLEELNKLQQEYKEKCQEVRKVNLKNNQLEDQVHSLRGKGQRASQQIIVLKKDKKELQDKIQTLHKTHTTQLQHYSQSSNNQNSISQNSNHNSTNHNNNNNNSRIKAQYYSKTIKMTSIDQVDEKQQRSRGPSAHQNKHHNQQNTTSNNTNNLSKQWLHRYQLLQGINAKLKKENDCYRKKSIEYEFKMNKLKEEFDLLSKLINEYRDQNDKLNKILNNTANTHQANSNYIITAQKNIISPGDTISTNIKSPLPSSNQTIHIHHNNSNNSNNSNHNNTSSSGYYYSQTKISGQKPQKDKLTTNNQTGNLTTTKNGSSVTFRAMNLNEYNQLKQSMHHIQNQISQKHLQNSVHNINSATNQNNTTSNINLIDCHPTMVTLPIDQIHMLINQIDRLLVENKNLSNELNDHKVMMIKYDSSKGRYQENLATIVIMVVEIQALRHRVAVAQAQREHFRRQSLSPSKSNK